MNFDEVRPVPFAPNYSVSRSGVVWRNGRKKSTPTLRNGYAVASLWTNNVGRQYYVHRLVLETFVGPCPEGCEALHINGVRGDNRLSNLRWGTRKENVADAIAHGTATVGARNGAAKLSNSDVGWIRDMRFLGFLFREIAPHFKISETTARRAAVGITYKEQCE